MINQNESRIKPGLPTLASRMPLNMADSTTNTMKNRAKGANIPMHGKPCGEVPMTRWKPPEPMTGLPESIGREVARLTAFEITMILLTVIGLLIQASVSLIALLSFLDQRNNRRK